MPQKIILVSGISNSGKTTSIRQYLNMENVFHLKNAGDITIVFTLQRRNLVLGVASGGDTLGIVRDNFNFFSQHACDVIVCASKSRGRTVAEVQRQAQRLGARLIQIPTVQVPNNLARQQRQIAQQIFNNV